ncbi:MAG: hypothetical protein PHD20_01380 [Clostridia bacterium]|nr:hypothetical protein [Clostridia bacterium]
MKKKKTGISLITLGITISVMTLIAGAVILSTSGEGIFNKADEAVFKDEVKEISEAMENKIMVGLVRDDDYDNVENYTSGEYLVSNMKNDLKSAIRGDLNDDISVYKYYILDMQKLVDNYGVPKGTRGYGETEDDIYIIEEETRNIYYVKTPYPFVSKVVQESPEDMELEMIEVPELNAMTSGYLYGIYSLKDGTFYVAIEDSNTYESSFYYYDGSTITKLNFSNYWPWDTSVYETKDNKVYLNYGDGSLYKLSGATFTKVNITENISYYGYFLEYSGGLLYQDDYSGTFMINDLAATKIIDGDGYGSMIYSKKDSSAYITQFSYYDYSTALYRFDGINVQEVFNTGYDGYISTMIDGAGNLYIYGNMYDSGYYIKKVEGSTIIPISLSAGNINATYSTGKELYIKVNSNMLYKIVGRQAIRVNLPIANINAYTIDRNTNTLYVILSGQGLFQVKGLDSVKIDSSTSSFSVTTNMKRKLTYLYRSNRELFLLNETNLTPVSGMLGSSASYMNVFINTFNGKMYAYDRDSSSRYNFYKLEGSTATKIQGINSTNSGYFNMNNYNGEVFLYQGVNIYRIRDDRAELISNKYYSIFTISKENYIITNDNKLMKVVYK